jgi:hypothetical protein
MRKNSHPSSSPGVGLKAQDLKPHLAQKGSRGVSMAEAVFRRGAVTGKWSLFAIGPTGDLQWVATDALPDLWRLAARTSLVGQSRPVECPLVPPMPTLPQEH